MEVSKLSKDVLNGECTDVDTENNRRPQARNPEPWGKALWNQFRECIDRNVFMKSGGHTATQKRHP
jgi:hypothetical protein